MRVVNLLQFLNNAKDLYSLEYAKCDKELIDFLDLMTEDEQFTRTIDFGIIFVNKGSSDNYTIVDGLNRILSLSILLHAICECYKKTTPRNEKAISTIRSKYLTKRNDVKLHLPDKYADVYKKIINGERLSGKEKAMPMFVLLHKFWTQIKTEKLQAAKIFNMLSKIKVTVADTENVSKRDLYYKLNSFRKLDQIALINDFIKQNGLQAIWDEIIKSYFIGNNDIKTFLKDFFITKFNYKTFNEERLYESFVNYFETMMQYMSEDTILKKIEHTAGLYHNMINLNFTNDEIRKLFINIKKHSGEDTYAYILNVYEDYYDSNISEDTFIEILKTIDEYLKNRQNSDNNVNFNELILYLNAFITCK